MNVCLKEWMNSCPRVGKLLGLFTMLLCWRAVVLVRCRLAALPKAAFLARCRFGALPSWRAAVLTRCRLGALPSWRTVQAKRLESKVHHGHRPDRERDAHKDELEPDEKLRPSTADR